MYEAIVCRLSNVRPHSNADRLQCATAEGREVIVGLEHTEGELGILFPEGGTIVESFCLVNGLYRKHPETGEALGGYLDANGRVVALKLRGELSFGLWLPIGCVGEWLVSLHVAAGHGERTGVPVLSEGDRLEAVAGHQLCEKYLTPATRRALAAGGASAQKARAASALPRHYDTTQLRDLGRLPVVNEVYISEKIHGTSGRTGHVEVEAEAPLGLLARAWNRIAPDRFAIKPRTFKRWQIVSGTRNCLLDPTATGEKAQSYRQRVADDIAVLANLERGEVWYYEIAGYDQNGAPIMAPHNVGALGDPKLEKQLRKQYGDRIVYDYGCDPGQCRVFVYRITKDGSELSWPEVVARAVSAGFEVPEYESYLDRTLDEVRELATLRTRDDSAYSSKHPREGVCLRIEADDNAGRAVKHKGFVFCALEGIARNDPDYLDAEEAA